MINHGVSHVRGFPPLGRLDKDGYTIARGLLDPDSDLASLRSEYASLLNKVAKRLQADGNASSAYTDLPFGPRLIVLVKEMGGTIQHHMDICLPQQGIKIDTPGIAARPPHPFSAGRNNGPGPEH